MHTGPTASPENSYLLLKQKQKQKQRSPSDRLVRVVTHSPNIDMGVLRQISNIYTLALSWARAEQHGNNNNNGDGDGDAVLTAYLQTPEYLLDQQLARRLRHVVMMMPNGAIPLASPAPHVPESGSGKMAANTGAATATAAGPRPDTGFMSSLMKRISSHAGALARADALPPNNNNNNNNNNNDNNNNDNDDATAQFILDEYVHSPLASNRSSMQGYPHTSRPNSDRCDDE